MKLILATVTLAFFCAVDTFAQVVVIYLPNGAGTGRISPKTYLNDKNLGRLQLGAEFIERTVPGMLNVKCQGGDRLSIKAEEKQFSFVKVRIKRGGFKWSTIVEQVDRDVAEAEHPILKMRLREVNP